MHSLELNHLYLLNEKACYYNTANVICQVARSNQIKKHGRRHRRVLLENEPERKYIIKVVSLVLCNHAIRIAGVVLEEQLFFWR